MIHDNSVHGLWIGTQLSKLELLTLHSFVKHNGCFHLWVYDELDTELPRGVTLHDAATILPRQRIFKKSGDDPAAGLGHDSFGPFSDLFRYKLLHDVGGIWVDMDVTCLKSFDFKEPYVFRPHTIGIVGNLIKAPRGSELMRLAYENGNRIANEHVPWLTLNRLLSQLVTGLELTSYIKRDIINEGTLDDILLKFANSSFRRPPTQWYAIHWANEHWNKSLDKAPSTGPTLATKNKPLPGSYLHELYRLYNLTDPRGDQRIELNEDRDSRGARIHYMTQQRANTDSITKTDKHKSQSIKMLIPTLSRGGAERIVLDVCSALAERDDTSVTIYVKKRTTTGYTPPRKHSLEIVYLDESGTPEVSLIATALLGDDTRVVFTHMIERRDLEKLWALGFITIPVIHNSEQGWGENPKQFDHQNVPIVIACADAVRLQTERAGCPAPVVTIRHELPILPNVEQMRVARRKIRELWGLSDDDLLIGMIGQFKSQKGYTRAVRVLARLKELCGAHLMIVGGWNHNYGNGRAAYEAAMRLAVELGVVTNLITVGQVDDPFSYLAAFDVFLNTSVYEGLSISLMEAIASGCPIVTSKVGGAAEIVPPESVLVDDPADIDTYVAGILHASTQTIRTVPTKQPDSQLIPSIWLGLNKTISSLSQPKYPAANGVLFVIEGLQLDGPSISLVRILTHGDFKCRTAVAVMNGISVKELSDELDKQRVPIWRCKRHQFYSQSIISLLDYINYGNYSSICFWNARPEHKLLLTKLLSQTTLRIFDVSPGPMLFEELAQTTAYQTRIAFSETQYFDRLTCFVALHKTGIPSNVAHTKRAVVIPLGAPTPPQFIPLPPPQAMPPMYVDPEFAIGTTSRLVPYKKIELLIDAFEILRRELPRATLTVVGGPDIESTEYAISLQRRAREQYPESVFFVGPHLEVDRFLNLWKVFVLSGEKQGCPNASLEAMAMGLPVVAFKSGGLNEQVVNGKTGYLVDTPKQMATRIKLLLCNADLRRAMGHQARQRVSQRFSITKCANSFAELLGQ